MFAHKIPPYQPRGLEGGPIKRVPRGPLTRNNCATAESPLTLGMIARRIQPRSRCRAARDRRWRGFQRGSPAGARRCGTGLLILGGAT
jgi:hypothetical protein